MKELENYKNNNMKKRKIFLFFSFLFFSFFIFKNCFALEIPKLNSYINDFTNTLGSSQKNELENELSNFDKETSNQIVVLVIDSLNNEYSIEDYSLKVAELNKIGTKGKDNGILLTVVKNDKTLRIEVGYGLEGFLTDAKSSYIIRKVISPNFKNGDYYTGIKNGLTEIEKASTEAGYLNDKIQNSNNKSTNPIFGIIIAIFFVILFIKYPRLFLFLLLSGGFNDRGGKGGFGSGSSGFGGGFSGGGGGFGGGGSSGSW